MIIPKLNYKLLSAAIKHHGLKNQIEKYEEELIEVLHALNRYKKTKSIEDKESFQKELCDNLITLIKAISVVFEFSQSDFDRVFNNKENKLRISFEKLDQST